LINRPSWDIIGSQNQLQFGGGKWLLKISTTWEAGEPD